MAPFWAFTRAECCDLIEKWLDGQTGCFYLHWLKCRQRGCVRGRYPQLRSSEAGRTVNAGPIHGGPRLAAQTGFEGLMRAIERGFRVTRTFHGILLLCDLSLCFMVLFRVNALGTQRM